MDAISTQAATFNPTAAQAFYRTPAQEQGQSPDAVSKPSATTETSTNTGDSSSKGGLDLYA